METPRYTIWEAVQVSLALGARALEEIRALARTPGPPGRDGKDGKDAASAVEPDTGPLVLAMLEKLRTERLDLDQRLFEARLRFDKLADDIEAKVAGLKDGEPGPQGEPGPAGRDGVGGEARGLYDP